MTKFEAAVTILGTLNKAGYEAYLVGGCVRDMLLDIEPKDFDVTTNARPEQVQALFPSTLAVGAQFGVIIVGLEGLWTEVATYRTDGIYSDGRRPDEVKYSDTAKEDVIRRDFTINGLLYSPLTGRIVDYVDGQNDLKIRVLRAIGDPWVRFKEDPVRILRGVKFAYRYGFDIAEKTVQTMILLGEELGRVSKERLRKELLEIMGIRQNTRRRDAMDFLHRAGFMTMLIPELDALVGCTQPPAYHPEGDVFVHTQLMIAACDSQDPNLLLAVLLHDIGKPATRTEDETGIHFRGHAELGATMAEEICERLKMSRDDIDEVVYMVKWHMALYVAEEMALSTLKKFFREPVFPKLLELHRLDILCSNGNFKSYLYLKHMFETTPLETLKPLRLLTGDDLITLGFKPGPKFKEILGVVETMQLDGKLTTPDEAFEYVKVTYV